MFTPLLIFIFGFFTRLFYLLPSNTILGFDQARDLWDATTVFRDFNLRIIGPTAGNNPNLHHGILFIYYLIPGLILFGGNPIGVTIINSIFNAATSIVLYFFGKSLLGSRKAGIIAALISAVSFQLIQYSGWISNPTVTIFTVPVFFWGLWEWHKGQRWGAPLAALFLGLSIEFELFFLYLIPTAILFFILLKPKFPNKKIVFISTGLFVMATSTMIITEIKYGFAGVKSLLGAGSMVGGSKTSLFELLLKFSQRWEDFYLNLWPQRPELTIILGVFIVSFVVYELFQSRKKEVRQRDIFLLLFFFSPAIMLLLGYHNAPWFLIGRPSAVILITAYLLSKIRYKFLLAAMILLIIISNLAALRDISGQGETLLGPDKSALMTDQIEAVDYTYKESNGEPFAIDTVTNPLYINALWSYHYYWYGQKKYGYSPTWLGGDQVYPYNTLSKATGDEKYWYVIIDNSPRIGNGFKENAINSASEKTNLVEEKQFGGIIVQKRIKK